MAKNKSESVKDTKKKIKGFPCSHTREIYLTNFHFQKKHDRNQVVIKDILITINSERTPEQIESVMADRYYLIKALRNYFKAEGRVFHQEEALEKYALVKIDFIKMIGISFAK